MWNPIYPDNRGYLFFSYQNLNRKPQFCAKTNFSLPLILVSMSAGQYTPVMLVQKLAPRLRKSTRPEPRLVGVDQMVSGYRDSLHSHTTLTRIRDNEGSYQAL